MIIWKLAEIDESGSFIISLHRTKDGALKKLKEIVKKNGGVLIHINSIDGQLFDVAGSSEKKTYHIHSLTVED